MELTHDHIYNFRVLSNFHNMNDGLPKAYETTVGTEWGRYSENPFMFGKVRDAIVPDPDPDFMSFLPIHVLNLCDVDFGGAFRKRWAPYVTGEFSYGQWLKTMVVVLGVRHEDEYAKPPQISKVWLDYQEILKKIQDLGVHFDTNASLPKICRQVVEYVSRKDVRESHRIFDPNISFVSLYLSGNIHSDWLMMSDVLDQERYYLTDERYPECWIGKASFISLGFNNIVERIVDSGVGDAKDATSYVETFMAYHISRAIGSGLRIHKDANLEPYIHAKRKVEEAKIPGIVNINCIYAVSVMMSKIV